jgi:hypothetical protein
VLKVRAIILAGAMLLPFGCLAQAPIVLPIEVLGPDGYISDVPFQVNVDTGQITSLQLVMTIHGLEYLGQGAVQLNGGTWIPIANNTLQPGLQIAYGGIGGGFSTLTFSMTLPLNSVRTGLNGLRFQFIGTDGNSSGFRVLNFNLMAGTGVGSATALLPPSAFTSDNPNTWQPPSTLPSDIAAGQALWKSAALTVPVPGGSPQSIRAHCGDCHTQDGRDLKYFNYSNYSIHARAVFHGLTPAQGDQIASYIRSLSVPNPGLPWNPPYQPGPGLDSQPVSQWAAGAGLGAVLASDAAMLPYVAPTLTAADFDPSGNPSIRETPIAFQLPDWNRWLPRIHPVDVWGSTFTQSKMFTTYRQLSSSLVAGNAQAYAARQYAINDWAQVDKPNFRASVPVPDYTTATGPTQTYSLNLWQLVKMWEINQEFGLEGMSQTIYGRQGEPRSWMTNIPFMASPSINQIPPGAPGIGNGSVGTFEYFSFMWYYSQLILNDGSKQQLCTSPVDWGYLYGSIGGMSRDSGPQGMLLLTMLKKALQLSNNGKGPQLGCLLGWSPVVNDPSRLVSPALPNIWTGLPASTISALVNSYTIAWYVVFRNFTPQQFYTGGYTSPSETVTPGFSEGNMASRFASMIPHLQCLGVGNGLGYAIVLWAAQAWPTFNWLSIGQVPCRTPRLPADLRKDSQVIPQRQSPQNIVGKRP